MANEQRLIDANALSNLLDVEYRRKMKLVQKGETHLDTLAEGLFSVSILLGTMPTVDAVEVVRCKDCKWRQQDEVNRNFCGLGDFYCGDTDFCSRGERKEDGKE